MSPTVEAAWIALGGVLIGVGGTVIVAVVGFRSTRRATETTIHASHDDRLWDRKADAYSEVMAAVLERTRLRFKMDMPDVSEEQYTELAREIMGAEEHQKWQTMEGRLSTCASRDVNAAYGKAFVATENALDKYTIWRRSDPRLKPPDPSPPNPRHSLGDAVHVLVQAISDDALQAFQEAMEAAANADIALETAIRADLHLDEGT